MKWIFKNKLPVTVCFLLGIVTGCLAQGTGRRERAPDITVVMPQDYCGEFVLYIVEDPDLREDYEPGDRYHIFNMRGLEGAVVRLPYLKDGWFTGFTFYDEHNVQNVPAYFRRGSFGGWEGGSDQVYYISPSLSGCPDETRRVAPDGLVKMLEGEGQFPDGWRDYARISFEPQIGVDSEYLYTEDGEHLLDEHGHPFIRYWHEDHPLYGSWDSKHILVLLTDTPHSLGYKRDGSSPSVPALRQFDLYDFYLHARTADGAFMYNEDGSPALVFHDGPRGAYNE